MMAAFPQLQHFKQFLQIFLIGLLVIQQHRKDDILFHRQFGNQIEVLKNETDIPAAEYSELSTSITIICQFELSQ